MTLLQAAVVQAGHLASAHTLKAMGWTLLEIEAAVRRGELRWTRAGVLEVIEQADRS